MKDYYPSFNALSDWKKGRVRHLFTQPVEILANSKSFVLVGDGRSVRVEGRGRLFVPALPKDVKELLARLVPKDRFVPKRFWVLTSGGGSSRKVSLVKGYKSLIAFYRVTPLIREFLYHFYHKIDVDLLIASLGLGVSLETLRVIEVEQTLKTVKTFPDTPSISYNYKNNLARLDCVRTVLDGVALCYHEILKRRDSLPSAAIRMLSRLKLRAWWNSWDTAKFIKDLAVECRAYYFGRACPRHPLVNWMTAVEALQFSYLARSMPSPILKVKDKMALIKDLSVRLTMPPPIEPTDWREFIRKWLSKNRGSNPIRLSAEPSVSAALGYSGERWGHSGAYRDIWVFQLSSRLVKGDLYEYLLETVRKAGQVQASGMFDAMFLGDIRSSKVLNAILMDGCETILDFILESGGMLPAQALAAPEKGLKVRVPTLGLTAANLVQQAYRKAADHFLLNDPRSSRSLGGKHTVNLDKQKGMFYSQDLSYATDCHGFWAQRVLYEEVQEYAPELRRWERFIPLFFGPRRLILPDFETGQYEVVEPPTLTCRKRVPRPGVITKGGIPLPMYARMLGEGVDLFEGVAEPVAADAVLVFDLWFPAWSSDPNEKPYQDSYEEMVNISANGIKLARVPVSLEAFVFGEKPPQVQQNPGKFSTDKSRAVSEADLRLFHEGYCQYLSFYCLETGAKAVTTTRGAMMGEPTSWAVLPLVSFYALAKINKFLALTTGDDALVPNMTQADRLKYDAAMTSLGGVISQQKSFLHPRRGLFCEVPYVQGKAKYFFPLSYWTAPSGGSKGEVNWYNLPAAFAGSLRDQGFEVDRRSLGSRGLFKYSKFRSTWKAAINMGLPIGAPEVMGGINVPHYPVEPNRLAGQWFAKLSSLSLPDLHLYGGLSLVPQMEKQDIASAALLYNLMFKRQMKTVAGEDDVRIDEALVRARNPAAVRQLFSRPRLKVLKHAPSVRFLAQRFQSRIIKTQVQVPPGSVSKLYQDLVGKRNRYVPNSASMKLMSERNFGYAVRSDQPIPPLMWGRHVHPSDMIRVSVFSSTDDGL